MKEAEKKAMREAVREGIRRVIKQVPRDHYFDSHTVIAYLLQNQPDNYLRYAKSSRADTIKLIHANLAKVIKSLVKEGIIKNVGKSWSKNIKDKFSKCHCWQKK